MNTEAADPTAAPPKTKADRYVKLGFLLVTLCIVGYLIIGPHISKELPGWQEDLDAALTQAAAEDRQVVVLAYDSPQNLAYDRLRKVVSKEGNRDALAKANVICVHLRLDKGDAVAKQFEITAFPTTLLIGPDGKIITRRVGYIGEVAFRQSFLAGKAPR